MKHHTSKTKPPLLLATIYLGLAISIGWSSPFGEPPSALVIIATNGSANEFSPVVEYTKVEFESGLALKVVLSNGQTVSIPKG